MEPIQSASGSALISRLETFVSVAKEMQQIAQKAASTPARCTTAVAAIATGIFQAWNSNLAQGAVLTGTGAKELYNIFVGGNDCGDLGRILSDAGASVDAIKALQESNTAALKVVDNNVKELKVNVTLVNDLLKEIGTIATNGSKALSTKKQLAENLCKGAELLFKQGREELDTSREYVIKGHKSLEKMMDLIAKLTDIAVDNKGDRQGRILTISNRIQELGSKALADLKIATEKQDLGVAFTSQGMDKFVEANGIRKEAMQQAYNELAAIGQKSVPNTQAVKLLDATQKKLTEIENRMHAQSEICEELTEDLKKARELAEGKLGDGSILFGLSAGYVASGFSGPAAVGVGYTAAKLFHARKTIIDCASRIRNLIFGKPCDEYTAPVKVNSSVSYQFDAKSSACFASLRNKKQSWTHGIVKIKVGDKIVSYRFDLNQNNKIEKKDLNRLQTTLYDALKNNRITHTECREILAGLEDVKISRADTPAAIGFMNSTPTRAGQAKTPNPYFFDLLHLCDQKAQAMN